MSSIYDAVRSMIDQRLEEQTQNSAVGDHEVAAGILADLEETGFADIFVPESLDGSGGTFEDLAEVIQALASKGVSLPLAQRNIGAWIYADSGLSNLSALPVAFTRPPHGRVTATTADRGVTVESIRFLETTKTLIAPGDTPSEYLAVTVSTEPLETGLDYDLTPTSSGYLSFNNGACQAFQAQEVQQYSNAYSLLLLLEADELIAALYRLSVDYAKQRAQFGRPIASFPAVQDLLTELAQTSAVSNSAYQRAYGAWFNGGSDHEIAAATWLVADGAMDAIRAAHQVHGAIGMTQEYQLNRYTRRLHQLRNEIFADKEARSTQYLATISDRGFINTLLDAPV